MPRHIRARSRWRLYLLLHDAAAEDERRHRLPGPADRAGLIAMERWAAQQRRLSSYDPVLKTRPQANRPAACSVITKKVPDIRLQNPAITVASITNSKRRRSTCTPRSVLRMMMKGAAKT